MNPLHSLHQSASATMVMPMDQQLDNRMRQERVVAAAALNGERVDHSNRMNMGLEVDGKGDGGQYPESRDYGCTSSPAVPVVVPEAHGDCRDDVGDCCMEREESAAAAAGAAQKQEEDRYHVPLKRYLYNQPLEALRAVASVRSFKEDKERGEPRRKRQRISGSFYSAVPTFSEGQLACMEYFAPSSYTPFFSWLGYSKFTIQWVVFMYFCHTLQTFLTDFGPKTKKYRCQSAFIGPLLHCILDAYLWNHSFITMMLVWPHWFAPHDSPNHPYWMAVGLTMFQQQTFMTITLKSTYTIFRDTLSHKYEHTLPKTCPEQDHIRNHLFDGFLIYGLSDILFVLSKLHDSSNLFWIGLIIFNAAPICLVWAFHNRLRAFEQKVKSLQ